MQLLVRITFCCAFYWGECALAQSLEGYVRNAQGHALPQARVALAPETGTYTDDQGYYRLGNLAIGQVEVTVSYLGYISQTQSTVLSAGQTVRLDFQLAPDLTRSLEAVAINAVRGRPNAPIAQTTVSQRQIEQVYTGQDGAFLLDDLSPSVIAYSESGSGFSNYGAFRMRGIDQTRVNLTLNGVPLNDMLDQGVFFSNFPDFGNSLQSVQVQRGVGTSTNGTAAYAGSINFESENLRQQEASAEVQLNAGSFDTYRVSGEFKTGMLNEHFSLYGRLTNATSGGYRYHSDSDNWSMFFSGGYFDDHNMVKLTAFNGRSQSNLAYYPVPLPQIQADPRTNVNFPQDRDDFGQQFVQLTYTRLVNAQLSLSANAYYGGAGGDFPFGYDSVFSTVGPFLGQINYPLQFWHHGFLGNLQYEREGFSLHAGLHGYRFKRRNWETALPDHLNTLYDDSTYKDEGSLFVKASYAWGRFTVFGDIQGRLLRMTFEPDDRFIPDGTALPDYSYAFLNPKVGLNVSLIRNRLSAYASFGRSGREPTRFDLLGGSTQLNSENLAAFQHTETVLPEYVNDFEAGLRWRSAELSAQVNFFWMDFEQEIAPIGERLVFVQLRKNIENSFRRGIELEGRWEPEYPLYIQGFAALTDARIEAYAPDFLDTVYTDVRPVLTPVFMGQLTVGTRALRGVDAAVTARRIGEQYIEPTNRPDLVVPASFILDGYVSWQFAGQHTIALHAYNLLDEWYYTYGEVGQDAAGEAVPAYFVQPPRNVQAVLTLRF